MTVGALGSLAALVDVIRQMTPHALFRGALVVLAGMAGGAGHFPVLVGERERGLFVIEVVLLPGLRIVADRAVRAERAPVDIILRWQSMQVDGVLRYGVPAL